MDYLDIEKKEKGINNLEIPSCYPINAPIGEDTAACKRRLKLPFTPRQMIVGSCKGLVCLYTSPQVVALWNPLLQIFKVLPFSPTRYFYKESRLIFGLGYSRKNNDHKVVKILYTNTNKDTLANKVEIYSMKSNSWKSIECPAPLLASLEIGIFTNGCINWIVSPSPTAIPPNYTIMSFDIDKELFGQSTQSWCTYREGKGLQLPFLEEFCRLQQFTEEEKKSILSGSFTNLWKMKTLASENSWVRLSVLPGQKKVHCTKLFDGERMLPIRHDKIIRFLGHSINGMPWEEENDSAPSPRTFQIVCVSESLRLLDHNNM